MVKKKRERYKLIASQAAKCKCKKANYDRLMMETTGQSRCMMITFGSMINSRSFSHSRLAFSRESSFRWFEIYFLIKETGRRWPKSSSSESGFTINLFFILWIWLQEGKSTWCQYKCDHGMNSGPLKDCQRLNDDWLILFYVFFFFITKLTYGTKHNHCFKKISKQVIVTWTLGQIEHVITPNMDFTVNKYFKILL